MSQGLSWVARALVVYLGWMAITLGGGMLATGPHASLSDLVIHGVGLQFLCACLFLLATIVFVGWPSLGFVRPQHEGWWKLLWLPALFIAAFAVMAANNGLLPPAAIGFVFLNTAMVGFSEETMFRGILFQAFRKAMPIRAALGLSTILFGALHVLNGFITGDFAAASTQAVAAAMSGLMYMALLIRTGSIWPSIIAHGLWDFTLFLTTGPASAPASPPPPSSLALLGPLAFALPSFLYGLYLLRKIPENIVTQDK